MRLRDWATSAGVFAAASVSIFALGGWPRWAQAIVAVCVVVTLISQIASRRGFARRSPLIVLLGIACGVTALQLVPLPARMLGQFTPVGAALREDGTSLVGVSSASSLTLDQPATLCALAFFAILLGVAIACLRMSTSERGRYRILAAVALLCGVVALIVGIHALLGLERLYGVYQPVHGQPYLLAPLLNGNHLGCLMAVGTLLAVGLLMFPRQRTWVRVSWLAVLGACGATTLATMSRGATIALAGGSAVTCLTLLAQRFFSRTESSRRRSTVLTTSLPIAVVVACAVVVVLYASAGGVAEQLATTSVDEVSEPRSKFAAWQSAAHLVDESPWIGVGRGAFESAFTRVHPASAYATFSHAENEYVQAAVDWGVPVTVLMAVVTIWFLVSASRRWRDGPLAAGAFGAITAVMLQSNVDFGIELLGIALPVTAVAATLAYVPMVELDRKKMLVTRGMRVALVIALAVLAFVLFTDRTKSVGEDHEALLTTRSPAYADILASIERHPVDYLGYAFAAEHLDAARDPRAIRVLNHALALHPTHSGLHLLAARILYKTRHEEQAAIEYAAALGPSAGRARLLDEIIRRFPAPLAARAIPADGSHVDELMKLVEERANPQVARLWLERVLELRPNHLRACDLLYGLAIRRGDIAIANSAIQRCSEFDPSYEQRTELAEALLARGGNDAIIKLLPDVEQWTGRVEDKRRAWLLLCDAYIANHDIEAARRCLRRLDASGLVPADLEAEVTRRLELVPITGTSPMPSSATPAPAPSSPPAGSAPPR